MESKVQRLQEFKALPSKLASLEHDAIFLKKSVELAQEEAKLANEVEAQARQDMEMAQKGMLEASQGLGKSLMR